MVTLYEHLMTLYESGLIEYEDLITKAQDPEAIINKLQGTGTRRR